MISRISMMTSDQVMKGLEPNDFVVYVTGFTHRVLVAGVYQEQDGVPYVFFFKNGKLTREPADIAAMSDGFIVGTETKSFDLRDLIIKTIAEQSN